MLGFLICDDHALMRDALGMAIGARWPDAVLSYASDYPEAFAQAAHHPALVLLDLAMPGADERDGVRQLMSIAPDARVLIVTGSTDDALLIDLFAMGVSGFVPKTSGIAVLLAAIERVLAGERYLRPRGDALDAASSPDAVHAAAPSPVTERQRSVLRLLARGLSNKEIARELNVSPATVKVHVGQLIAALGAVNRTDVAIKATARKLI